MSEFSNHPTVRLPEHLQAKHRNLLEERTLLDEKIRLVKKEIAKFRDRCEHERPAGLTGREYAVYCTKCGRMIDSWL
jgi:hypothetical protein